MPKLDSDDLDLTVVPFGRYAFQKKALPSSKDFYRLSLNQVPFLFYEDRFLEFDSSFEGFLPETLHLPSDSFIPMTAFDEKTRASIERYLEKEARLVVGYLQFRLALKELGECQEDSERFKSKLSEVFTHYDHFKKELLFYQRERLKNGQEPFQEFGK
jgi:hypothetical protein